MQATLLGVGIAIILALLAALVGPYFVDWDQYRAVFEAQLVIFARNRRDLTLVLWRFYNGQIGHYRSYDKENLNFLPVN